MKETALDYFRQISAIPRASGNEEAVARYIEEFARARGLFAERDAANNVLVRKPAAKGRENEPAVLLQAHTDMVAERTPDSTHDFAAEGVELIVEGNIMHANKTTLGADDGFGVAMMMAVLADDTLSHPALECLFTSGEEIGMIGIEQFDFSKIKARLLVNLDSACEPWVTIGCCGGVRTEFTLPFSYAPAAGKAYRLEIAGLCGGHSGEDIHRGRLNAHILLGILLSDLAAKGELRLISADGGNKDNAIPRACTAEFFYGGSESDLGTLETLARAQILSEADNGLTVTVTPVERGSALSAAQTTDVIRLLSVRNGVLESRPDGRPFTSRNFARIRTDDKAIRVGFNSRSPLPASRAASKKELDDLAAAIGGETRHHAEYEGWETTPDNALVRAWQKAQRSVTGKEPKPLLLHAGLECGVICGNCPGMDAISVGCNVHDLHSPAERMELDSFARVSDTLAAFLAEKFA